MSSQPQKLLIATGNPGKIAELNGFLKGSQFELVSLSDFPDVEEVEETGLTFEENAKLKATGYALQTGLLSLADDSGLEVVALDDRPGVLSARYGGDNTTFAEKMTKLLGELDKTGNEDRRARFVCSMTIADPTGEILLVSKGVCEGRIAPEPRGNGGFGYDPLFIPDGYESTFGELSEVIKQKISHRSRAFCEIIPFLQHFIAL